MDAIFNWIETLTSFQQGMLGSAVFAFTSLIARYLYKKVKLSGAAFMEAYSTVDVHKHILHKEFIRSSNPQLASYGSSIALLLAARWMILGILILVFFFGINSFVEGNWLYVAASWFTFNCMLEARDWLKDSSSEKNIKHVPDEKVALIYESLNSNIPEAEVETNDN